MKPPFIRENNEAFTLLEIMICVLIIGSLTIIAVPSFQKARESARILQAQHDVAILHGAIDRMAWDTGCWPGMSYQPSPSRAADSWDWPIAWAAVPKLTTRFAGICSADSTFSNKNWNGPYLSSNAIPLDPWGSQYFFDPCYFIWTNGQWDAFAVVGSFGPNRRGLYWWGETDNIVEILQTYGLGM